MSLLNIRYEINEGSLVDEWLWEKEAIIADALSRGDLICAQDAAMDWANNISQRLGLKYTNVWKLFKRSLAAKWFGKPENKAFLPNWSVEKALEYAHRFDNQTVRFSRFGLK